ncbi:hypothetical protein OROHE_016349 [Orobanche hederae]
MWFLWTLLEFLFISASVFALGLVAAIVFATYRRKYTHSCHAETTPVFEDPNSLKSFFSYLEERARKDKLFSYEVVIVDDGSADGTKRVAFEFVERYMVENVRVILLGRNHGKGEAIKKGMLHSRGELLLMLDADGATKVSDLEKLENQIHALAVEERGFGDSSACDLKLRISDVPIAAFGSRAHLEEKALATRKWYRNFLMKGFHLVVLLAAGSGIRDTQCGFKMFTRSAARKLFMNIRLKSCEVPVLTRMGLDTA